MSQSLKHKAVKGTFWSTVERFSVQGILFVVMIVMARILTPADYGLVGMLTIFIAVSQSLVDSGFSQALIRKQERTHTDNCTVFYFNIVVGLAFYLILFFCAPLIARFYNEPALVPLTRVISLSIVINSLVVVQRALYTVNIDFKTQAKASLTAAIISGAVGITMAYTGFGYWAIVAQQLLNLGVNALLLWWFSSWRPGLRYSHSSFREFFGFGSKLAVSGILDTVYRNVYLIVIGKIFSASDLGYYTRAHQFSDFPSANLTGVLQRVTFPILCSIQNDDKRLADVYRRFLRLSAFVIFPLMMGLSALSEPLIDILLNPSWSFTATLLTILCFAMMWYPIHAINLNLLQVKGRTDLFLRLEVWKKCIGVAILCVTVPLGLVAMCAGSVLSSIISLIINTYYTGKMIGAGFFVQMRDLFPTLVVSLLMWCVAHFSAMLFDASWLRLLIGTFSGAAFYAVVSVVTRAPELKELTELMRRK